MDNRGLAKKGRYGDTHIRDVYGLKSHVNKSEADIIDSYGLLGEAIVKEVGAGTINPKTGMPEYHVKSFRHNKIHTDSFDWSDAAHPEGYKDEYGLESLSKADFSIATKL